MVRSGHTGDPSAGDTDAKLSVKVIIAHPRVKDIYAPLGQKKTSDNDDHRSPQKRWQDMVVVAVMPEKPKKAPRPFPFTTAAPEKSAIYRPALTGLNPDQNASIYTIGMARPPANFSGDNQLPPNPQVPTENSGGYQLPTKAPQNAPEAPENGGVQPPLNSAKAPLDPNGQAAPPISPALLADPVSRSIYQNAFVTYGYGNSNWLKLPRMPFRSALRTSSNLELETPRGSLSLSGVKLGDSPARTSASKPHNTAGNAGTVDRFFNFVDNLRNPGDSNLGSIRISEDLRALPVAIKRLEGSYNLRKAPHDVKTTEDSFNFGGLPAALRSYEGFDNLRTRPTAVRSALRSIDPRKPSNAGSDAQSTADTTGYLPRSILRSIVGTGGGLYVPPSGVEKRKGRAGRESGRDREDGGRFISSVFKSNRDDRGPDKGVVSRHGTGSSGLKRIIRGEGEAPKKKKRG